MFASITHNGELILNGFGSKKDHMVQQIINDDYLHDFDFVDENRIILGAENSLLYVYDIRKGLEELHNKNDF